MNFLAVTSGASGSRNGTVNYNVGANTLLAPARGQMAVFVMLGYFSQR